MQSPKKRLEEFSLKITPAVLTVLMVLFAAVPLRIPGAAQVMPVFALINIYYWGTFYPGALPYVFLFALGLLEDTLTGLPLLGVSSLINLVFALVLTRERHNFGKTLFGAVWLGFASLSLMAVAIEWIVMSIYLGRMVPVGAHLLQWLATCLVYPPMHLLLTRVYRMLVGS
jgi:rod shape-determining protein MreD